MIISEWVIDVLSYVQLIFYLSLEKLIERWKSSWMADLIVINIILNTKHIKYIQIYVWNTLNIFYF